MTALPMSARLAITEERYQEDKAAGHTINILDEPTIFKGGYKHFKLVENRYPYDAIFKTHHMLVAKRLGANEKNFTVEEQRELAAIEFAEFYKYSCVITNYKAKSIKDVWHIHLGIYHGERPEWLS